jgi:hypothetical protein
MAVHLAGLAASFKAEIQVCERRYHRIGVGKVIHARVAGIESICLKVVCGKTHGMFENPGIVYFKVSVTL